ncbi:MAG TPA: hypothetical protein VGE52_05390, partial [Pirellulales bacterium]
MYQVASGASASGSGRAAMVERDGPAGMAGTGAASAVGATAERGDSPSPIEELPVEGAAEREPGPTGGIKPVPRIEEPPASPG